MVLKALYIEAVAELKSIWNDKPTMFCIGLISYILASSL